MRRFCIGTLPSWSDHNMPIHCVHGISTRRRKRLRRNSGAQPSIRTARQRDRVRGYALVRRQCRFFQAAEIEVRIAGFLIGLRPGTPYASPNYRWFCDNYDDFAYVDRVAVSSWARHQGVARTLYDAFCVAQRDAPLMACEVNVRPPNKRSILFHQRMGFRQVGSLQADGGKKEVALMEKRF